MGIGIMVLGLFCAFMIGSIPTAFWMGKCRGIDIRAHGSGNVGATNAFRILGRSWGVTCLIFDMFKGAAPVFLFGHWMVPSFISTWPADLWAWIIGLMAVLGHMFSPFVGFRGGKGVAASLGIVLAITPLPMLIVFGLGLIIIFTTGYVSVASITGAVLLPWLVLFFDWGHCWTSFIVTLLLGAMIVWKHRANLKRLCQGTESRLFLKKEKT